MVSWLIAIKFIFIIRIFVMYLRIINQGKNIAPDHI